MISRTLFRRRSRRRASAPAILGSYTSPGFWQRHRIKLLMLVGFYSWFVGMFFAVTTTYFLVPLLLPLAILTTFVIWLLPDAGAAPTTLMSRVLFAFVIVLLCWPNYVGINFPGLPWITMVRMVTLPLGLLLLISLSISAQFRRDLADTLSVMPVVPWLLGAFAALAFLSIFWSTGVGDSANKFSVAIFSLFVPFFVAVHAFRTPGRLQLFGWMIWAIVLFTCAIGGVENHLQKVLWAGHLPALLSIQDETVQRILSGTVRSVTGKYRVVSVFSNPLVFAEFLGLAAPFIVHFAFTARRLIARAAAVATLVLIFWSIFNTDSRMGMVNFFLSVLFYLFFWSLHFRRSNPESPVGTIALLGYPVAFAGFLLSTFFVGKIRHLVWGDGSQQSSNNMRMEQLRNGIPKVMDRPWGWGIGRAGDTLAMESIDNFYLTVGLEYGILGMVLLFSMFGVAIWNGARRAIAFPSGELSMIVPLCVALINFLIVKLTLSQQDSHGFVFIMLGALVATCWRFDREVAAPVSASAPAPARTITSH